MLPNWETQKFLTNSHTAPTVRDNSHQHRVINIVPPIHELLKFLEDGKVAITRTFSRNSSGFSNFHVFFFPETGPLEKVTKISDVSGKNP